jgi:anti-sigma regulatory factor (Ser/Thr protein kinase)
MATTLVCRVVSRQPVAVVALYGTLDQTSVARALVAMRDCLAEAPGVMLVDVAHLVVASPAALTPVVGLVQDARRWPAAQVGFCGGAAAIGAMFADFDAADRPYIYADLDAGLTEALTVPVAPRATLSLRPVAGSPAHARGFVSDTCEGWRIGRIAKIASLVASELVTNAVVHARTPLAISLRLAGVRLHVAVRDGDPRPMQRPPAGEGEQPVDHGRGLLILDAMADEWGCHPTADGKVVWAAIGLTRPPAIA